jgi:DNA-binding NtrC family response regulator
VRVDDPSVSRQHAVLHVGDSLEIEDLSGANGVFLREKARPTVGHETLGMKQLVRRKAGVSVGDRILLGTVSFVVRHASVDEVPDLAMPSLAGTGIRVRDPAMRAIYEQAARAARASISVLLLGETGCGKEVLARAIHAHSPRAAGPFMGINCAALAESLLESELFGHEKGAFTGAAGARAGLFEAANGKLLRVLEERVVVRLGSTRPRPIDVRFVAATNRDIEGDSGAGRFRPDLYFRLAGIALTIPPLRERPAELEILVRSFVASACRELDRGGPLTISARALEILRRHVWPGNVRELRNVIGRATVLCAGDEILPEHLPPALLRPPASPPSVLDALGAGAIGALTPSTPRSSGGADLQGEVRSLERTRIIEALHNCGGNQSKAAASLGISRRTLVSRIAEFGLPRPRKPV